MSSLKLTFKNNRIAIISGAIVYGVLLLYFTGNVVYKDHQALVSRIAGFEKNISDLKNDIHDRDIAIQQLKERIATAVVPKPVNLTGILQLWAFCPFHFTRTLFPFLSERPPGSPSPAALTL
jgi:hypothetical protein